MNTTTRNVIIGVVIVLIVVLLGYLAFEERQQNSGTPTLPISGATTTTPVATSTGVTVTIGSTTVSSGGYTITPITAGSAPAAPDYKTSLSYPASMSADEQAQYQGQFATIQTTLASSPTDWGSWIDLGILRQDTGDYQGAKADWTYVTEIYPTDPTAFADLGNLYATYLSNDTQAIADYKEAIKLDPTNEVSFYQNLAQVYLSEGDTTDAKAVLLEGIDAQVAGYQSLQTELSSIQ